MEQEAELNAEKAVNVDLQHGFENTQGTQKKDAVLRNPMEVGDEEQFRHVAILVACQSEETATISSASRPLRSLPRLRCLLKRTGAAQYHRRHKRVGGRIR